MLLMIDNYDSFTYNVVQYLGELGADVQVYRNDAISVQEIEDLNPSHLVLSPGPCTPNEAGISLQVVEHFSGKIPLLGICLGHQSIGQAFGADVVLAPKPMHGKVSTITHDASGVFAGLDTPFTATRYHSLTLDPDTIPDCLNVTAHSEDGVIQGISHRDMPIYGVQFHPESIASENGHALLRNFLSLTGEKAAA